MSTELHSNDYGDVFMSAVCVCVFVPSWCIIILVHHLHVDDVRRSL